MGFREPVLGANGRRRAVSVVAAACLGVALGSAPAVAVEPVAVDPHSVASFDGTAITFYWFPAVGLAEGQRAPTVLQGPGFGGKAQSDPDATNSGAVPAVGDLRRAGYNVLTWNPRGISPSGGQAQLNNPDIEGRDVSALITWLADQPQAQLDATGDPRVGMTGGSYGGGIQFSTAALDHRIDVIVPVIAWNSLATSLYKADTIKTAWINALMAGASRPGNTFSPSILKGRKQAAKGMTFSPDVVDFARAAGPDRVLSQIQAPALIIQGTIDNLFPPSEAVANYAALTAAGVPTKMIWYCGGHGLCPTKKLDESLPRQQTWLWLQRYLKADTSVDTGPGFTWVDQRGRYRSAQAYPAAGKRVLRAEGRGRLTLTKKGGSGPYAGDLPASVSPLVGIFLRAALPAPAKRAVEVPLRAKRAAVVVGAPRLRLTYRGEAPDKDVRVLAQLVDNRAGRVVGHQITPVALRLDGKKHRTSVPLEAISVSLRRGQKLTLQVVAQSSMYNVFPAGGSVRFSRVVVTLPTAAGD